MQDQYSPTFASRFWAKVDRTGECWLWTAGTNRTGYGTMGRGGRSAGHILAHRAAWELLCGPIPDGLSVCHDCPGGDNPRCVNPDHLYLGTHAMNMADASRKGQSASGRRHGSKTRPDRWIQGERVHWARLTAPQVLEIRARFASGERQSNLAREFSVCPTTLHAIVHRKTWRHL
jgi:hypothetical protein